MRMRLVIAVVVATNITIPYALAVVVWSVSHALVLWVRVMVVTGVWGGGHMAGVLRHAKHTCWVWGQGGGGWEVGVWWGAVQVGSFVVVGVELIAVAARGQGRSPGRCVVMALAEVVTVVGEAVRWAVVVVGYIVVIMSMAVSSVMAMSWAVTKRSIVAVAVAIVVAREVAVMVGAYSITSLTHQWMAFPLLSQHHVLGTVWLPSWTPC